MLISADCSGAVLKIRLYQVLGYKYFTKYEEHLALEGNMTTRYKTDNIHSSPYIRP